eukprot:6237511-Prymnesium_polylepis.1
MHALGMYPGTCQSHTARTRPPPTPYLSTRISGGMKSPPRASLVDAGPGRVPTGRGATSRRPVRRDPERAGRNPGGL